MSYNGIDWLLTKSEFWKFSVWSVIHFFFSFFLFCGSKFRESERSFLGAWKVSPVYLGALTGLKAKNALTAFACTSSTLNAL